MYSTTSDCTLQTSSSGFIVKGHIMITEDPYRIKGFPEVMNCTTIDLERSL